MTNPKVLYLSIHLLRLPVRQSGHRLLDATDHQKLSESLTHTQIGLIAMLPYIVATVAMILWSRSSDKRDERKLHSAIPLLIAALGMVGAGHCRTLSWQWR